MVVVEVVGEHSLDILSPGFLSAGFMSAGVLSPGFLSAGFLSHGFLSAAFLSPGFLSAFVSSLMSAGYRHLMPVLHTSVKT